ncbi:hypothetical protein O181_061970 [Austropuccinia psidii MF-1]|uniref:Uncharacterized protein n=1 Tax=Austropuccinia psidii MF-1 TaxID=1389203 RepID=A0A9Q3EG58_9BASI|nr:hypothetical protein [Austropuccinia psidii MF-1]
MTYSEKELLKQLPEASSWPTFSGVGEYDHMELIYYVDRFCIDVPIIPDYGITARLITESKGNASICHTEMKEIHGRRNRPWWNSQLIQKYSNVATEYRDNHFHNWEKKLFSTKEKNIKSASGKMESIGTIIKGIIICHRKGNIRLNP